MVLSYLHKYHAGNIHDIVKHSLLCLLYNTPIIYNRNKAHRLCIIDTHTSTAVHALNNKEQHLGIDKLICVAHINVTLQPLLSHIYQLNKIKYKHKQSSIQLIQQQLVSGRSIDISVQHQSLHNIALYPGSTYISQYYMNPYDHLYSCELHKNEYLQLQHNIKKYCTSSKQSQISVRRMNGYELLQKYQYIVHEPYTQHIVIIDPSYETKNLEYEHIIQSIIQFHTVYHNTIFMIWSPIYANNNYQFMKQLYNTKLNNILNISIQYRSTPDTLPLTTSYNKRVHVGLVGSNITIVNTPYMYEKLCEYAVQNICNILSDASNPLISNIQWIKKII